MVPFYMTNVGVRAAPSLPWVSTFPELNVRTYVRVGNLRNEVIAVVQSWRQIVLEVAWRSGHDSVSHDGQPSRRPANRAVSRVA